jgi:hypothetical protein
MKRIRVAAASVKNLKGKPDVSIDAMQDWKLDITPDHVLRAQGADPAVVRQRNPPLVEYAERALRQGIGLLQPVVVTRHVRVKAVQHQRIVLEGGKALYGKDLLRFLAPAREVVLLLCTIGGPLEDYAALMMAEDFSLALALDGFGTAAVEALSVSACSQVGEGAAARGLQATIPLSPGMDGWPVEQAAPQFFALLPPEEAGIRLTESWMMVPRKSVSMVIGLGEEIEDAGRPCDYCNLRQTCRYQDTYA